MRDCFALCSLPSAGYTKSAAAPCFRGREKARGALGAGQTHLSEREKAGHPALRADNRRFHTRLLVFDKKAGVGPNAPTTMLARI